MVDVNSTRSRRVSTQQVVCNNENPEKIVHSARKRNLQLCTVIKLPLMSCLNYSTTRLSRFFQIHQTDCCQKKCKWNLFPFLKSSPTPVIPEGSAAGCSSFFLLLRSCVSREEAVFISFWLRASFLFCLLLSMSLGSTLHVGWRNSPRDPARPNSPHANASQHHPDGPSTAARLSSHRRAHHCLLLLANGHHCNHQSCAG